MQILLEIERSTQKSSFLLMVFFPFLNPPGILLVYLQNAHLYNLLLGNWAIEISNYDATRSLLVSLCLMIMSPQTDMYSRVGKCRLKKLRANICSQPALNKITPWVTVGGFDVEQLHRISCSLQGVRHAPREDKF